MSRSVFTLDLRGYIKSPNKFISAEGHIQKSCMGGGNQGMIRPKISHILPIFTSFGISRPGKTTKLTLDLLFKQNTYLHEYVAIPKIEK